MARRRQTEPSFATPIEFDRCQWLQGCPNPARIKEPYGKFVCVECYGHAMDHWRANRREKGNGIYAPQAGFCIPRDEQEKIKHEEYIAKIKAERNADISSRS